MTKLEELKAACDAAWDAAWEAPRADYDAARAAVSSASRAYRAELEKTQEENNS